VAKRKQRHEEHPDERWLITYADVLTLMYVLFMVLFSISVVNTSRFELLKESLTDAFNSGLAAGGTSVISSAPGTPSPVVDTPTSRIAPEVPTVGGVSISQASPGQILETSQLEAAEKAIDATLAKEGLGGRVSTSVNERGLAVRLRTDGVLFDPGAAVLRSEGARIVAPIAASLKGLPNPIRVEGHTDSTPISTSQFPSNFALSGVRAAAVVVAMQSAGIPSSRLQVGGFGDTRPIADNDTEAGRSENRRVEILILRLQGSPSQSPADALGAG
jgi:chemotaxis protein MotB